jgi:hypothetical protein
MTLTTFFPVAAAGPLQSEPHALPLFSEQHSAGQWVLKGGAVYDDDHNTKFVLLGKCMYIRSGVHRVLIFLNISTRRNFTLSTAHVIVITQQEIPLL